MYIICFRTLTRLYVYRVNNEKKRQLLSANLVEVLTISVDAIAGVVQIVSSHGLQDGDSWSRRFGVVCLEEIWSSMF